MAVERVLEGYDHHRPLLMHLWQDDIASEVTPVELPDPGCSFDAREQAARARAYVGGGNLNLRGGNQFLGSHFGIVPRQKRARRGTAALAASAGGA